MCSDKIQVIISLEKVKLFAKYFGDIDDWTRMGSKKEKKIIDEAS